MKSVENSTKVGEYNIIEVYSPSFLNPDDNFVGQFPLNQIPQIIAYDIFKDKSDMTAIAEFIRFSLGVEQPENLQMSSFRSVQDHLKKGVATSAIGAVKKVREFVDQTPHLREYINYYFLEGINTHRQLFDRKGNPTDDPTEVETFLFYQKNKIIAERALSTYGLKDDDQYPSLATGASVEEAISHSGKSQTNQLWRLVTKSGALG